MTINTFNNIFPLYQIKENKNKINADINSFIVISISLEGSTYPINLIIIHIIPTACLLHCIFNSFGWAKARKRYCI